VRPHQVHVGRWYARWDAVRRTAWFVRAHNTRGVRYRSAGENARTLCGTNARYPRAVRVIISMCARTLNRRGRSRVAVRAGNRRAALHKLRPKKTQACAGQVGGARGGVAANFPRAGPRAGAQAHRRADDGRLLSRHDHRATELAARRRQIDLVRYAPRTPVSSFGARAAAHRFRREQAGRSTGRGREASSAPRCGST
jgi:hypothetical protein